MAEETVSIPLFVSYSSILHKFGLPKIMKLLQLKTEDPDVIKSRVESVIFDIQSEFCGMFACTETTAPEDVKRYVIGIIPTMLEYRLSPVECMEEGISNIYDIAKNLAKARLAKQDDLTVDSYDDVYLFVV